MIDTRQQFRSRQFDRPTRDATIAGCFLEPRRPQVNITLIFMDLLNILLISNSKPSMLDLEQLHRRLTSYPKRLPNSDYLKDLDQKIPLVQQINQLCRQFHTDALMKELHLDKASFWSTLMTMDLERLAEVRRDLDDLTSAKAKRLLLTDFPAWAMATPMLLRSRMVRPSLF